MWSPSSTTILSRNRFVLLRFFSSTTLSVFATPHPKSSTISKLQYPPSSPHFSFLDVQGEIIKGMKWRDGDVVVSVSFKSGTTWTMNIVHQLRSKGDPNLIDIYQQVPWLDLWEYPTQPKEELYHRWNALPTWFPRAFKTHWSPPLVPFRDNLKYIVVFRDPRDAIESYFAFLKKVTPEFYEEWGVDNPLKDYVKDFEHPLIGKGHVWFKFLLNWWPYKNHSNVLMLHYSDMKNDHIGHIKKIAKFLNLENLTTEEFEKICEYTNFKWMKEHQEKFAFQHLLPNVPMFKPEGMIRSGHIGGGQKILPKPVLEEFEKEINKILTSQQKKFLYYGGPLP